MEPESNSFWSDIKKFEEILAKDPQSYCFAPLSELYRKVGLLDDALNVAKRGCDLHPTYVGGFMALGRAYHEKGMKAESRVALESVVRSTPDNLLAQKILSQIYVEAGEFAAAEIALRTILTLNPGDLESQVLLESLKRASNAQGAPFSENSAEATAAPAVGSPFEQEWSDDEFLLEELEVVEDVAAERAEMKEPSFSSDIISFPKVSEEKSEGPEFEEFLVQEHGELPTTTIGEPSAAGVESDEKSAPSIADVSPEFHEECAATEGKDPLTTVTLAELYVSQGFLKRAFAIYRELLMANPDNEELKQRLSNLKCAIDRDEKSVRVHVLERERTTAEAEDVTAERISLENDGAEAEAGFDRRDTVLTTLETWLENISRRRQ